MLVIPIARTFWELLWGFRVVRFVVSGGPGAAFYFAIYYLATGYVKDWFLVWGVIASAVNYFVNFIFQGHFAYDHDFIETTTTQTQRFLALAIFLTVVNDGLLYIFNTTGSGFVVTPLIAGVLLIAINYLIAPYVYAKKTPNVSS